MTAYAELEIAVHRRMAEGYSVELRLNRPDDDEEQRASGAARLDFTELLAHSGDPEAYGRLLAGMLFADPAIQQCYGAAKAIAADGQLGLRLRLVFGPSAPELHALRWEMLRDPAQDFPLFTRENFLCSRYLSSLDWRPVRPRPQGGLSALVVVANPSNLEAYRLAPIDTQAELQRATTSLAGCAVRALPANGQRATLDNLLAQARAGCDILFLACHGTLKDEAWLWLENDAGEAARVSGSEFARRLGELASLPTLVVLASCQSAGAGRDGVLAAVGPRLSEAGLPAVIAMQGDISLPTVEAFLPLFFAELQRDGRIDRALAVARGAIRQRADSWMPALFMRLKSGCLWYTPGFGDSQQEFEKWKALLNNIRRKECTPLLGPGVTEALLGSRRGIARRWAEADRFPMAPHERDDLPEVAQYLATIHDRMYPRTQLEAYLRQALIDRYRTALPDPLNGQPLAEAGLAELVTAAGAVLRERDPSEPHRLLAGLPFKIYVTANPDNLLADALAASGRKPVVEVCRWNKASLAVPSIYDEDREPDYRPTPERPLVYHLFGHLDEPRSVVVTEDDFFDYLIGITRNLNRIPKVLRSALASTALLFLGFQMNDWYLRVALRTILSQEGSEQLKDYAHVAAQIAPDEDQILEPDGARRYLAKYFQAADISVFWGSVEDFTRQLHERWSGGAA